VAKTRARRLLDMIGSMTGLHHKIAPLRAMVEPQC
jgi:hypothetical protein